MFPDERRDVFPVDDNLLRVAGDNFHIEVVKHWFYSSFVVDVDTLFYGDVRKRAIHCAGIEIYDVKAFRKSLCNGAFSCAGRSVKRDIEVFFVFCHKIIIYNSVNKSSVFSFENFNGIRRARRQPRSTTRFAD